MRILTIVAVAALVACGAPKKPDGGTGGGGFGGGGFGGGFSGGSGGGSTGGGTGGGSTLETVSLTIVESPAQTPVANALIRLSGPSAIGQGSTNDAGVALIALPANERPLDITVAKAGYGAMSILGLEGTLPTTLRIDSLAPPGNPTVANASGVITGKRASNNEVMIDAFMFNTFRGPTASYAATYATTAPDPLEMIALEIDPTGNVVNYELSQAFTRGPNVTWDVQLPITAPVVRAVDHVLQFATQGMLKLPLTQMGVTQVSRQSTLSPGNFILSGSIAKIIPQPTSVPVHITSVDGRFTPDLAYLGFGDQPTQLMLNVVLHDPMNNPRTLTLPQVDTLEITGTTLANVGARATASPFFDVLELSVGHNGTQEVPSWRIYTAKGKPFTIPAIPNLPAGVTPADFGVSGPMDALVMLIAFEDPNFPPWMIQPSEHGQPQYKTTLARGYTTIAPTWR